MTAATKERSPIRAHKIDLTANDGSPMVRAGIVVAGEFPEIVMWNGQPYLRDQTIGPYAYRRVRPYHLAAGE